MPDLTVVEDSIKHSIKKNGFPERVVRLPFKAVYESCKRHNTTLKNVLDSLIKDKIVGTIQGDHIEFCSPDNPASKTDTRTQSDNTSWMNGLPDLGSLKETAQSYMSQMTPEQIRPDIFGDQEWEPESRRVNCATTSSNGDSSIVG